MDASLGGQSYLQGKSYPSLWYYFKTIVLFLWLVLKSTMVCHRMLRFHQKILNRMHYGHVFVRKFLC